MSKRYRIADYLSDEQRAEIMKHEWYIDDQDFLSTRTFVAPDNDEPPVLSCPLGVAMGWGGYPPELEVAHSISPGDSATLAAVGEFTEANDHGRIAPEDLAAAIGAA